MMLHKHSSRTVWIVGVALLTLVVIGSVVYAAVHRKPAGSPGVQPTDGMQTPSPSVQPVVTVPEPTASLAPSPSAAATPSPSAAVSATPSAAALPDSAKTVLANFYAAYKAKDRERLATFFTADTTTADADLRSRLFKGIDTKGYPGGPTLFDVGATDVAVAYSVQTFAAQGSGWLVTVREQRQNRSGTAIPDETTMLALVPAPSGQGTWLIDSYHHAESSGKYEAFLLQ